MNEGVSPIARWIVEYCSPTFLSEEPSLITFAKSADSSADKPILVAIILVKSTIPLSIIAPRSTALSALYNLPKRSSMNAS